MKKFKIYLTLLASIGLLAAGNWAHPEEFADEPYYEEAVTTQPYADEEAVDEAEEVREDDVYYLGDELVDVDYLPSLFNSLVVISSSDSCYRYGSSYVYNPECYDPLSYTYYANPLYLYYGYPSDYYDVPYYPRRYTYYSVSPYYTDYYSGGYYYPWGYSYDVYLQPSAPYVYYQNYNYWPYDDSWYWYPRYRCCPSRYTHGSLYSRLLYNVHWYYGHKYHRDFKHYGWGRRYDSYKHPRSYAVNLFSNRYSPALNFFNSRRNVWYDRIHGGRYPGRSAYPYRYPRIGSRDGSTGRSVIIGSRRDRLIGSRERINRTLGQNRSVFDRSQTISPRYTLQPRVYTPGRITGRDTRIISPGSRYLSDLKARRERINQTLNQRTIVSQRITTARPRVTITTPNAIRSRSTIISDRTRIINRPGIYQRQRIIERSRDGGTFRSSVPTRVIIPGRGSSNYSIRSFGSPPVRSPGISRSVVPRRTITTLGPRRFVTPSVRTFRSPVISRPGSFSASPGVSFRARSPVGINRSPGISRPTFRSAAPSFRSAAPSFRSSGPRFGGVGRSGSSFRSRSFGGARRSIGGGGGRRR